MTATIAHEPAIAGENGYSEPSSGSKAKSTAGKRGLRGLSAVGAAIALAVTVAVLSLIWMAGSLSAQTCVAKAEAKYPTVPVSAYFGKDTGPTKVSFAQQRQQAVDQCSGF